MENTPRDQQWLEQRFYWIWQRAFPDLIPVNRVSIKFGRVARTRLGSIRMTRDKKESKILINRLFKDERVPLEVIDCTMAHELCHYLHGFSSPIEQKFSSPHAGGVVTKELKKRGFTRALSFQKQWLKRVWPLLLREHLPRTQRIHRTRVSRRIRRPGTLMARLIRALG